MRQQFRVMLVKHMETALLKYLLKSMKSVEKRVEKLKLDITSKKNLMQTIF